MSAAKRYGLLGGSHSHITIEAFVTGIKNLDQ